MQFQPGMQDPNYGSPFQSVGPGQGQSGFQFSQMPQYSVNPAVGGASAAGQQYLNNLNSQSAQTQQKLDTYLNPFMQGQLSVPTGPQGNAMVSGLELGKMLTGQNIGQTGGQIQDLLQRQLGLLDQGGNNPITSAMQSNKAQAQASANQEMARAGVKGGAAAAARTQVSRKLDRDIAAQAYQQYQDALGQSRQMVGGIASAQLSPMYQNQQAFFASQQPELKPQNQTLWSFLGL